MRIDTFINHGLIVLIVLLVMLYFVDASEYDDWDSLGILNDDLDDITPENLDNSEEQISGGGQLQVPSGGGGGGISETEYITQEITPELWGQDLSTLITKASAIFIGGLYGVLSIKASRKKKDDNQRDEASFLR